MFDVIALGELLVDFTGSGASPQGNPVYEANPGGAPCNVLAMLKKLGRSCAFIGKVGEDLVFDRETRTTLAFVKTFGNGDRDFSFYRNPGADMMLREEELPLDEIAQSRVFHFGTLSMTHEGARRATVKAVEHARAGGAVISFDPNLRPPLWDSLDEARRQMEYGLSQCGVLKIADNELEFMTGEKDFDKGAAILRGKFPNIRLFNVTAGAQGSYSYYEDKRVFVPACRRGGVIETTGAGDTFCACVLDFVLARGLDGLTREDLSTMLRFANTAAYLVTTRKGALRSMPDAGEEAEE